MPLSPGQVVLQRYRVDRLLGQGGFGAVYRVWDINLERTCALKENLELSGETARQFGREARLLANLSHPNLPRVTDHFKIQDQGQYLVMDFIEGEDLEQRLARTGRPLDLEEVINWFNQVCDALTYLHRHDPPIIHRDIKPANIRITPNGRAVLVDFGIAKLYQPQMRTTIGARAVTPGYSPPEQYGRGFTDERSDVYALGATVYTLLTASMPPDSVDQLTGSAPPPRPIHESNPAVAPRISLAVAQAMSVSREERFSTVDAFRNSLADASASMATKGKPSVERTILIEPKRQEASAATGDRNEISSVVPSAPVIVPISKPKSKPSRKFQVNPLILISIGALVIAFIGLTAAIFILYINQPDADPTPTLFGIAGDLGAATVTPMQPQASATFTPTLLPSPTEISAPTPSQAPGIPPVQGAVRASFPTARLAFVSDHGDSGYDQIYILSFEPGEYWFLPEIGNLFTLDEPDQNRAVSDLILVPMGSSYDMAWWPEWCEGDRRILFEGQNSVDSSFQTIYIADFNAGIVTRPFPLAWDGIAKIGVPRCANHTNTVIVSALNQVRSTDWQLYRFTIDQPDEPEPIGDGFPFSGFARWSGDDRWFVFMHSQNGLPFVLYQMAWDQPGVFNRLPVPDNITTARFPSVSPVDDRLVYACPAAGVWGLCIQRIDGSGFKLLLDRLAPMDIPKRGVKPAVSAITPAWSPDGHWIAFSAYQEERWDIYLLNVDLNIQYNLTRDLIGNQFQPAWSKP